VLVVGFQLKGPPKPPSTTRLLRYRTSPPGLGDKPFGHATGVEKSQNCVGKGSVPEHLELTFNADSHSPDRDIARASNRISEQHRFAGVGNELIEHHQGRGSRTRSRKIDHSGENAGCKWKRSVVKYTLLIKI